MRRGPRKSNHPGRGAVGGRGLARAWRAGAIALALVALLVVSVAPRAMAETGARPGAAADCLSHDPGHSTGGPSHGVCHLGGACCVSECLDGSSLDGASARACALPRRPGIVARAFAARGDRLCLAGWASAWSSRAPPRRA